MEHQPLAFPRAEVELIAASGIIRIKFDASVTASALTDSILEGSLVERAYVVRALDGSIFIDAHLSTTAAARTYVRQNPIRVAIEIQPTDGEPTDFPKVGGLVVVTEPPARVVEYPITIRGYARTFEATVVAAYCIRIWRHRGGVHDRSRLSGTLGEFAVDIGRRSRW